MFDATPARGQRQKGEPFTSPSITHLRDRFRLNRAGAIVAAGTLLCAFISLGAGAATSIAAGLPPQDRQTTIPVAYLSFAAQNNTYDAAMLAAAKSAAEAGGAAPTVFDAGNSSATRYTQFRDAMVGYIYDVKAFALDEAIYRGFSSSTAGHTDVKIVAEGQSYFTPRDGLIAAQSMLQSGPGPVVDSGLRPLTPGPRRRPLCGKCRGSRRALLPEAPGARGAYPVRRPARRHSHQLAEAPAE